MTERPFTVEAVREIMNYQERLGRIAPEPVESEATKAREMMFVTSKPGRYVGDGRSVREVVGR
jgi:hypothetical protein